MEMVLEIFKQLGANESLLYQFVIVVVVYFLAKFLFLDHLQSVLDTRENNTVNLEGSAEEQFKEIDKIQNEYKEKIQSANKEIKAKLDSKKAQIISREESKYRELETEVNSFVEKSRKEVEAEIQGKREKVLSEAEELAGSLVQKITKEI